MSTESEKHTAGPWRLSKNEVAVVCDTHDAPTLIADYIEHLPNARLMAAAPELLEALKAMLHHYCRLINSGDCGNWNPEEETQVKQARAAIAKAEGREA